MWGWYISVLCAVVLSAIAVWAIYRVLRYVTEMQEKYYALTEKLAEHGIATQHEIVHSSQAIPIAGASIANASDNESDQLTKTLQVKGPQTLAIGVETSHYVAIIKDSSNDKQEPAQDAKWTVKPEDAASLSSSSGPTVKVTPSRLGAFILHINNGSSITKSIDFPIASIQPAGKAASIPFIGEGWGYNRPCHCLWYGCFATWAQPSNRSGTRGYADGRTLGYIFGVVTRPGNTRESSDAGSKPVRTNKLRRNRVIAAIGLLALFDAPGLQGWRAVGMC